jgi:hypothetical protein
VKLKSKASIDLDRMIEELDDGTVKSPRQAAPKEPDADTPPQKPYLEMELSDLRGFEIAPRGSYIVFNTGKHVFIHPLIVHEKLIKVMRPHYTTHHLAPEVSVGMISAEMSSTLIEQIDSIPEQLRLLIKKRFKENKNSYYEGIVRS